MTVDDRRQAPAAARNRDPILAVLRQHLPDAGLVVEVASGTGEHIVHFAQACSPRVIFQPSDPDPAARASIDAWIAAQRLVNVLPAMALDARALDWPVASADAVLCINMVHISPWTATEGLMRGAARILSREGFLYLYGPYRREDAHTAESNVRFDQDLRRQNPEWGIRDLEAVAALAAENGFASPLVLQMPANNLSLIFRRDR